MPDYRNRVVDALKVTSLAVAISFTVYGGCKIKNALSTESLGESAAEWIDNQYGNKLDLPHDVPEYYEK